MIQLLQATNNNEFMVQNGKIFLVMTIVSIILIGLFLYVANIDKKITNLEK
jgi:hypothetical protein